MATRPILIWPDLTLKEVSVEVGLAPEGWHLPAFVKEDPEIVSGLIPDMFETMYASNGVGLAAIQVGVPLRIFVMDAYRLPDGSSKHVFVNPRLELFGDPVEVEEGCLSLPGVVERAMRHRELIIRAHDLKEPVEEHAWQLDDLEAQIAQHEVDHLDGKLFVDGAGTAKRDTIRRKIQKTLRERKR